MQHIKVNPYQEFIFHLCYFLINNLKINFIIQLMIIDLRLHLHFIIIISLIVSINLLL